jgi:hypothetical protein
MLSWPALIEPSRDFKLHDMNRQLCLLCYLTKREALALALRYLLAKNQVEWPALPSP